ncbi:phosphoprotein phosphatase [Deinococcus sp. HMF7620]|uniref:Phosphoprotein phosphatase n=1 Tax=Deinococcus arboris TaxID=2682977 RepID=A0A7C9HST4_9DEIO|nr:HAD family hydrolase [Deinococcus arboris]MVN87913.1 phosphoprotein phosphatase [Deinococcus arboris]
MTAPLPRPLLVLDLDETLWHGVPDQTALSGVRFGLRPFLGQFLHTVSQGYDLAVWTAASEDWMLCGLDATRQATGFDLRGQAVFLWARDRCAWRRSETGELHPRKPARKFRAGWVRARYPRSRILVVDDLASNYACGYGHLVKVTSWTGAQDDTELLRLGPYLLTLAAHPDLRQVEKRGWQARSAAD